MKKAIQFFESIPGVAAVTAFLLLIPLVAMQFTGEVNWSISDFIIMGILIFTTGTAYVLITRFSSNFIYKAAFAAAIGSTFLMIWANLAVGLIGSGPNAANMMYIGVVGVVIIGTFLSRFTATGMGRAMFATAIALVLHAVIALMMNMQALPGSSVAEIIAVNAFFAFLYSTSGLLFRFVSLKQLHEKLNA